MTVFEAHITASTINYLKNIFSNSIELERNNELIQTKCGIMNFFNNQSDIELFNKKLSQYLPQLEEPNRRAYGDFQTNENLASNVTNYLAEKNILPEFILEPTCGKGNFVIAALQQFLTIRKLVAIEIYLPYVWETKLKILDLFINDKAVCKPQIYIYHDDIFSFDLGKLAKENQDLEVLIIGNPPWVTNSELSTLNSKNLPRKSNFKNHKGLDAMTGKGNFDIGEFISSQLIQQFQFHNGYFAFLIKNAVVKNIIAQQKKAKYTIAEHQQFNIDSKKEFNVSVDACLYSMVLNRPPEYTCQTLDFYTKKEITTFGWQKDKFVYSIKYYQKSTDFDGKCSFVWRQGMKHDCSKVMELDRFNDHYMNGLEQELNPEKALLYRLLKSSDLKNQVISTYRKTTIVTQKKVGQDTTYIKDKYPKTYEYLLNNKAHFDKRKSSIYTGKPAFSIFGIGDYSFAKYKVAISGLYKRTTFSLVLPDNDKPVMLDDTCYFIGFEKLIDAEIAQFLLNSDVVQNLLSAIIFPDAKRSITKDVLMRIDLKKVYGLINCPNDKFSIENWDSFGVILGYEIGQISLF
jgi:hypothetical protein